MDHSHRTIMKNVTCCLSCIRCESPCRPPSTFTISMILVSHPIRLATNLLKCICRAWLPPTLLVLSSTISQTLHHWQCHLSRFCLYFITVHPPLSLPLPPLLPSSWLLLTTSLLTHDVTHLAVIIIDN